VPLKPQPRGAASAALLSSLSCSPSVLEAPAPDDFEDLQLALYCCYELHYRGFDGVDPRWEWEPSLLAFRASLEQAFEADLRALPVDDVSDEVDVVLRSLAQSDEGPSLSKLVERSAELWQVREFMVHRSAYQLKEADPHSWAIPRLWGAPKAALVEVQADEYGGGRPERVHAELFRRAMIAVGLDGAYGAYLDVIPGVTLATVNLMSLFGLHRRLRGALVGHLALFEMTSSIPNRRYAAGLRRLGFDGDATAFFDEHVLADAVHESIAAVDLAGGLARQDPSLTADIVWGARALLELDRRWAAHVLAAWDEGASSLHSGAPVPA
jgi:hypothetical protein